MKQHLNTFFGLWIFLVIITFCLKGVGQDYHLDIRQLSVEDGLLHREVSVIHQDRNGFIWIATPLGLNRYDGYKFKYFTRKTHALQTNRFDIISEDQGGRIWLFGLDAQMNEGNISSIDILLPEADKTFPFDSLFAKEAFFSPKELKAICLTSPSGELIFQHADSLYLIFYDIQKGFRKQLLPESPSFQLRFISPAGTLWGKVDNNNWAEINPDGEVIRKVLFDKFSASTSIPEVSRDGFLIHLSEPLGTTYFVDWQGNKTLLPESDWYVPNMLMPALRFVSPLLLDAARDKGINIQDSTIYEQLKAYFLTREGDHFRALCQTKQSGLWLGGNFGAYQIQFFPNPFTTFLANPYDVRSRSENIACRGLWTDGQQLIVNQEPGESVRIELQSGKQKTLDRAESCLSYANKAVTQLSSGKFLMSTGTCLMQVDEAFEPEKSFTRINFVRYIFEENPHRIWLGFDFDKGVAWFDMIENELQTSSSHPHLAPLRGKKIPYIAPDQSNRIWLCTNDGLYRYTPEDSGFIYHGLRGKGKTYLPAEGFKHFMQDEAGIFWLATKSSGLIRWNPKNDSIMHFMREDGLPNNTLYAVYEDDYNHLWIPSDYGIIQFDKESYSSKTYLPDDGTSEIEFNTLSHTRAPDGRLFFGSLNGVTSFHPKDFYTQNDRDTIGPPLRITRVSQFDAKENQLLDKTGEVLETGTVILNPDDRYFRVEMAMLEFGDNSLTQYIWRIEGWNDQWQIQNNPSIQLSSLPFGSYRMHVKAKTAKGAYSANDLLLQISVIPPFYKTTSFIVFVVVGLLLVVGLLVYVRIRNLRIVQEKLERKVAEATEELREMDRLKTRLFANVSHELRTPLSLILGPISTVLRRDKIDKKDADYLKLARKSSQSLQKLITEILDLGKLESGKLELNESPVNFDKFLKNKAASFQTVAENKGLAFEYESDLAPQTYLRLDKQMVDKVINNLLSNAIKFTPEGGRVSLQCVAGSKQTKNPKLPTANSVLLTVSDTGPGIHPDDLPYIFDRYYQAQKGNEALSGGTGIGLALSKELAELMGGSLTASSEWGKGTHFTFCLPWKEEQYVGEQPVGDTSDGAVGHISTQESDLAVPFIPEGEGEISILVTEDNPDLRAYLKSLLAPSYRVVTARHGREALQLLKQTEVAEDPSDKKIDLIITDLMMPEMDGFTLLDKLKKHPKHCHIPVIMLTARSGIHDRLKALTLGVHDYLTKPFEENELLIRINNLLQWASVRQEAKAENEKGENETLSQQEAWLQEVDQWVEANFQSSEIRMLDWAASLNLSESQFRRKMKQAAGLSPQQYLQEYRLKIARSMLEKQTVATVSEVAFEVGFSAADYFSKVFQKRYGKLPSQYFAA